jgi:hypothetical protein
MPYTIVLESPHAELFREKAVGDQVVFEVTGYIAEQGDSLSVYVEDVLPGDEAKSFEEAKRRATNEISVRTRTEPAVG